MKRYLYSIVFLIWQADEISDIQVAAICDKLREAQELVLDYEAYMEKHGYIVYSKTPYHLFMEKGDAGVSYTICKSFKV